LAVAAPKKRRPQNFLRINQRSPDRQRKGYRTDLSQYFVTEIMLQRTKFCNCKNHERHRTLTPPITDNRVMAGEHPHRPGPNAIKRKGNKMTSIFDHRPDRVLAVAYAILLTAMTFGSTLELFRTPLGSSAAATSITA
jgi:hypothetical protein